MYKVNPEKENKEIIRKYRNLLQVWKTEHSEKDQEMVRKAFNLAVEAHSDMRRRSGEPYVFHPIEVATIAAEDIGLGKTSIIAALLHDVVEDTDYTLQDIQNLFGDQIAKIIDGLTKIEGIIPQENVSIQAENFKKIIYTLSEDVRVIFIKLADRLHNMRTLGAMPREKQLKIASETIYLYAPLAHRLGLNAIKSELEDLSFRYSQPTIYKSLSDKVKSKKKEYNAFVKSFSHPITDVLKAEKIDFKIEPFQRTIYSLWDKMSREELSFDEVHDVLSIRIIINNQEPLNEKVECFKVYSAITDIYKPNLNKFKDWISMPRANGYKALHATVMSKQGKWVDIQIRTQRMDEIAEKGYAAYWKYKGTEGSENGLDKWLRRIRQILKDTNEGSALNFLDDFKLNLFADEIFVYTPKGELKTLPLNSTALDFAYAIHTDLGNRCIGAKVNHRLVQLNHKLRSGDQVEIITSLKQKPKNEWLGLVTTARAKSRIEDALKEQKKSHKDLGVQKLQKYLDQLNQEFTKANISKIQRKLNINGLIDLYYLIATDHIDFRKIRMVFQEGEKNSWLNYIKKPFTFNKSTQAEKGLEKNLKDTLKNKPELVFLDPEKRDLNYVLSTCCNPIPGDDVVSFALSGKPMEIHRVNCKKAVKRMSQFGNQIVKTKWKKNESIAFLSALKITSIDSIGFIHKITKIISLDFKLNIRSFHLESSGGIIDVVIMVYVHDNECLNQLIHSIRKVKGVQKVNRPERPKTFDNINIK
ncbi:MAG: bifunctional (p)ppGpp synthetase/guanosine-3',5'-bis(diphosphate) 3'-pyrophosphohydrolase [Bacteroidales bacterium]